jgi:hypothetical protein
MRYCRTSTVLRTALCGTQHNHIVTNTQGYYTVTDYLLQCRPQMLTARRATV